MCPWESEMGAKQGDNYQILQFHSRNDKVCLMSMERFRFWANLEFKGNLCAMGNEPASLALPKPPFKML